MIFVSKHLLSGKFIGITLWPFIFLKSEMHKQDEVLVNHEKIHLAQQLELLIVPFYIVYGIEYLLRLIQYRSRYLAYRNISFEREAYCNETNIDYLKNRSFWSFVKYINTKKYLNSDSI